MTKSKKTILVLLDRYLPGYKAGGPIQTIANMVEAIGDRYKFYIVTSDRDSGDTEPYPGIIYGQWMTVGKAQVRYLSPNENLWKEYRNIISSTDFSLLYCQSFFNPKYTILPLLIFAFCSKGRKPVLLAPRGEFGQGAIRIKRIKKMSYLFLFKHTIRYLLNISFQSSSEDERLEVLQQMGKKSNCFCALDFNAQTHVDEKDLHSSDSSPRKFVFLSRIDPKKNLDYALTILQEVKDPVQFDIYGNCFNVSFMEKCQDIARNMPANVTVQFKGVLPHDRVITVLSEYDLFFFPTKNENFGHVIHEALRAGLPVLCSDQTLWHELAERKAGWEIPLVDSTKFIEIIHQFCTLSSASRLMMRKAALQYGIDVSKAPSTLEANIKMFDALCL